MRLSISNLERNLSVGHYAIIEGWKVTKNSDGIYKIKKDKCKREFFDLLSALDWIYN